VFVFVASFGARYWRIGCTLPQFTSPYGSRFPWARTRGGTQRLLPPPHLFTLVPIKFRGPRGNGNVFDKNFFPSNFSDPPLRPPFPLSSFRPWEAFTWGNGVPFMRFNPTLVFSLRRWSMSQSPYDTAHHFSFGVYSLSFFLLLGQKTWDILRNWFSPPRGWGPGLLEEGKKAQWRLPPTPCVATANFMGEGSLC